MIAYGLSILCAMLLLICAGIALLFPEDES